MVYVHACTGMGSPDAIRDSPEAELEQLLKLVLALSIELDKEEKFKTEGLAR